MKKKAPGEAARTFLRQVRVSEGKIRIMVSHAKYVRSIVFPGALRMRQVQVQESSPQDTLSQKLAAVEDMYRRIEAERDEANLARKYAEEVIGSLPDKQHRQVLTLYYLRAYETYEEAGKTKKAITGISSLRWPDVAWEMKLPLRDVHRIHRKALIAFEKDACLPEWMYYEKEDKTE